MPDKQEIPIAEQIVRRIVESAIRLQWTRHWDAIEAGEITEEEMVQDALNLALGDDTGCLDEEEINSDNIDLLYVQEAFSSLAHQLSQEKAEVERMRTLLNTPETEDFDKAIPLEAAHQIERWGAQQDAGKLPADWFWLVGYLAGKALASHIAGNTEKAKHHCVSTAAVLRNWHAHIRSGETLMRPGVGDEKTASLEAQ